MGHGPVFYTSCGHILSRDGIPAVNDLLKIGAAFTLIVLLLRLRWNFGAVMLVASLFLGSLYLIGPMAQLGVFISSALDPVTVNLVTGLVLIMILENIIRKRGVLKRMMEAVVNVTRDRRIAMAVLPGVIGLLPSAGGAAFSAPMVQEASADADIKPERKAFINYWFRHIWEYCSPLYPGFVLAAAVTGISMSRLLLSQLPLPIAVVGAGTLLAFRGIRAGEVSGKQNAEELKALFATLLPILVPIVLVVVFKLPLGIAMASIVIAMLLFYGYSVTETWTTLRESVSYKMILMISGIMTFKGMLDASGAIEALPGFFRESGLPAGVVFFALPFIVGLLTGLTVAFVGATFPIIIAMTGGSPDPGVVTFAFASGFAGVMLSPSHLCLALTLQYFSADIAGTYSLLYLPVVLVFLVGLAILWV
jgi:integral membrane protein (TIGR00529 family)